jgi:hypothetical protein
MRRRMRVLIMDIEKILEEIRAALLSAVPTGGTEGNQFWNAPKNSKYIAEVHLYKGKFANISVKTMAQVKREHQALEALVNLTA